MASRFNIPDKVKPQDVGGGLFTVIDPKKFNACFIKFTAEINPEPGSQLVAIDGKAERHSF